MTVTSAPVEAGRKAPQLGGRRAVRNGAEARAGLLLSAPFILLFLVFTAWPVVQSMYMSFTDMSRNDVQTPFAVNFVGLDNYVRAVNDPTFRKAALNTAIFVVVGVPVTILAGLAAAVALDKGITKARGFFRMGFYTPVITSIVAVAVVWRFLLQPDFGIINQMLAAVGIQGPNWLGDERTSLLSLIMMAVWRNFGNAMIILLAGLQGVSWELHEAAALDGASTWQRFLNVTLPALRPTLLFVLVTTSIGYIQFFEEPFVMTQGGPLNSTLSASMYTFQQFGFGKWGYAGAIAYLTFAVILIVTIVQFRLTREKD
jgi:multiple sugar transport system permease protein